MHPFSLRLSADSEARIITLTYQRAYPRGRIPGLNTHPPPAQKISTLNLKGFFCNKKKHKVNYENNNESLIVSQSSYVKSQLDLVSLGGGGVGRGKPKTWKTLRLEGSG